eukprot:5554271-Ditylum_brightwellii.AAC.1
MILIQPNSVGYWRWQEPNQDQRKGQPYCWIWFVLQTAPFKYSKKEFLAEQGHRNHIRTADCTDADKAERDQANDDSGRESDWYSYSCIHPGKYGARKAAEVELKLQCNNKCVKHSY